jgi:hypothetical protein
MEHLKDVPVGATVAGDEPRRGGNSKAQGIALGFTRNKSQALKGRHSAMQSDLISPLQGLISIGGTISQGVALG